MHSKPLTTGDRSFDTQKAAEPSIKEFLNNQLLKTIPEPHHSFLRALVARHPRAAEKVWTEIHHFTAEYAVHRTRCFYLTCADGTKTDFLYFKCVRGQE